MSNPFFRTFPAWFLVAMANCMASPLDTGAVETISIKADEGREDQEPGILHFTGNFLMHSDDWHLTSSRAVVYGRLDRPDRVSLQGTPARFRTIEGAGSGNDVVEAEALLVEYERSFRSLRLSGDAVLRLGRETIRSETIEYDIDTERYRAGGLGGVSIEVFPVD